MDLNRQGDRGNTTLTVDSAHPCSHH